MGPSIALAAMRVVRLLMLMVAGTVLLSGCFRHQSSVVVNQDGSGSITETLVVDRGAVEAGDVPLASSLPRARDLSLPSWVTVADYATGDYEGLVLNVSFDDPQQCNERLNALHRLLAAESGSRATSAVELIRQEDGWQFTLRTNNVAATPDLGLANSALADAVYHGGQLTLIVELPGRVVETNADQETDGKLVWLLSPQAVQSNFYARTHTGGGQSPSPRDDRTLQLATAAATIGGLAVFAAVALSRNRDQRRPRAVTDADSHGDADPDTDRGGGLDGGLGGGRGHGGGLSPGPAVLGDPAAGPPLPLSQWPSSPPAAPPSTASPPHAGPPPPPGGHPSSYT